jgi:aminomethyltransferase
LGSAQAHGPGAFAALQSALTNDLDRIAAGRAQYTHLLDPADAHVVDDIIVWWVAPDDFLVMPNASNTHDLVAALTETVAGNETSECTVEDITASRAVLAVQGPEARALLAPVLAEASAVPRFEVREITYDSPSDSPVAGYAAGTGYTGEDGVELHVPASAAPAVWQRLLDAGIRPAGLGARDTLRLEAGLPLHGHELGPGITPLQAGLSWVVRFDKGDFRGRAPLLAEKERGVSRRLRGLVVDGRQIPRSGCSVLIAGTAVGEVTSGNFSPVLQKGIALAFLPPDVADGAPVVIDIRGRGVKASVVKPPFVHAAVP